MTIATELEALYDKSGVLRVEVVHDWARKNKESALHSALEWKEATAAREFRYWQIRRLIAIHVIDEDRSRQTISLAIDRGKKGGGYRRVDDVMEVPALREMALASALEDYERIREKYNWLKELAKIHEEIEAAAAAAKSRKPRAA